MAMTTVMVLSFLVLSLSQTALSAPILADHPSQVHLTEWTTLPAGERVSSPERMRRARMEIWDRVRSSSRRKLYTTSRSLLASNSTEVNALLAFRTGILGDPTGALANWTMEKNATMCSTWEGVRCDDVGRVVELELRDLGLNGTISTMIGNLGHLSFLNLSGSLLSGPIPSGLTRCQSLSSVDLSHNSLDGEVPSKLFALPELTYLRLSYNNFSGSLPGVRGCRSLTELRVVHTGMSGPIPSSLSRCRNLTFLNLGYNQFNGSIPESLGELQQLEILSLKNNKLTGSIPGSLGNCSLLTDLLLGSDDSGFNDLSGVIPEEFGNLGHLMQLGLEYNWKLTGPVPGFLSRCSNLVVLFLGACNFTSIAPEIWGMKKLEQIALFSNGLTGELPLEVANATALQWLDLGWFPNRLTGPIPPTLGSLPNLTTLSLNMNLFIGGIPRELGGLQQLELLWLGRNEALSGTIPVEISNLTTLTDIDLAYSNLTGAIPDGLFRKNPKLKRVLLNNNNLTGHLPDDLGTLQHLEVLYLHNNNFTGGIPANIGGCGALKDIVLSNNQLNGMIPASVVNLSNLESTLDLSQNYLSGNIPLGLGNLTKLKRLILSTNALNGTVPEDLAGCASLSLFDLSNNYFTGDIPTFLGNFTRLESLDLSSNALGGDVAALATLSSNVQTLRIGQNMIHGAMQLDFTKWPALKYFSAANNKLTGAIPPSLAARNSTLVLVDFSLNGFSGTLPKLDPTHLSELRVLLFSHNRLEGPIPSWLGNLKSLQVLDLSFNKLTGPIPQSFGNLEGYKVQPNATDSSPGAPFTLNQRLNLTFRGDSVSYSYILKANTFMDMSSNGLQGEIPQTLMQLVALKYLILSNNSLEGEISPRVVNLRDLETLDLSINSLEGPIPPSVPASLSIFNVSFNNLSGEIPTGDQFNTYLESYYLPGNPGLCGAVIQKPCGGGEDEGLGMEEFISIPGFGVGAVIGFFVVVVTTIAWVPARVFVFGAPENWKSRAKVQCSTYGVYTPRF